MYDNYLNILNKCNLFQGMTNNEIISILTCLNPVFREYNQNNIIDFESSIGIILNGKVSISKQNKDGDELILELLKSSEIFGLLNLFSKNEFNNISIKSITQSKIMFIPKKYITATCSNACKHHTKLINNILYIISCKSIDMSNRLECLSIKSMRGRICYYLKSEYGKNKHKNITNANIINSVSRNELAKILNLSRTSMCRELSLMKKENIIDYHLKIIKIKDLEYVFNY